MGYGLYDMGKVNIDSLEKGMVLVEDVKSGNQILLAKGVTLTNKHINIFKSWGVSTVEVDGACEQELTSKKLEKLSPKARTKLENKLKDKFRYVDLDFYPSRVLFNACLLEISKHAK